MKQPTHSFPAIRGRMGTRDYYIAVVPLRVLTKLISLEDWAGLPPEARAQRVLNRSRVPEITRYILDNEDDWLFSSLTVSFEGEVSFKPLRDNPDIGTLEVPMTTPLLINDGQHRFAAIHEALRADPTLGDQKISLVLFPSEGIERSQQMFSDLNRTARKTSRSLDILYDHRDALNEVTLAVAEAVPVFRGRVEREAVSLAPRSPKFVTLSALYTAHEELLGRETVSSLDDRASLQKATQLAVRYWTRVAMCVSEWQAVEQGAISPATARAESISSHAVGFWAFGNAGRAAMLAHAKSWEDVIVRLKAIDWRRSNPDWQGICMLGPDVVNRRQTRTATADYVKWKLGLIPTRPAPVLSPADAVR